MKSFARTLVAFVIIAGAGYGAYSWLMSRHETLPTSQPPPPVAAVATPAAPPSIHYPVPAESPEPDASAGEPAARTLPMAVDESDSSLVEALIGVFGKERFAALFNPKDIVRRIVVTADNTTAHSQPSQDLWPLKPPALGFVVTGKGDDLSISPRNYRRYQPFVDLISKVSLRKLVAVYRHFYPLFQTAYRDLGTQGYFNDRVVAVINHLLQTPDLVGAVKLVPGIHGRYAYANTNIEALSSGQKILVRMGFDNAQVIKTQLRELRVLLTHMKRPKGSPKESED